MDICRYRRRYLYGYIYIPSLLQFSFPLSIYICVYVICLHICGKKLGNLVAKNCYLLFLSLILIENSYKLIGKRKMENQLQLLCVPFTIKKENTRMFIHPAMLIEHMLNCSSSKPGQEHSEATSGLSGPTGDLATNS